MARSCVAVVVVKAGSYSSNLTPGLGSSICRKRGPKKQINNYIHKKEKKVDFIQRFQQSFLTNSCQCNPEPDGYSLVIKGGSKRGRENNVWFLMNPIMYTLEM